MDAPRDYTATKNLQAKELGNPAANPSHWQPGFRICPWLLSQY
jgi:hypothetical protein